VPRCTTFRRFDRTTATRRTVGGRKSPCRHHTPAAMVGLGGTSVPPSLFLWVGVARAAARWNAPTGIRPGSSPFSRTHRSRTSPEGPGSSPYKGAILWPGLSPRTFRRADVTETCPNLAWTGPARAFTRAHRSHARASPVMPVQQSTPPGLAASVPSYRGSVHRNTGVASGRAHRLVFRRVFGHTINRII
jgi:hypothetical protein